MRWRAAALAAATVACPASAQDYSTLDTPQELPAAWLGSYARDRKACADETDLEGVTLDRKGLYFYEASALAQRIVWVNQDRELYLYALLGGEGSIGPVSYRIRRADDGQSIQFFGPGAADDEDAPGERLIRCPR